MIVHERSIGVLKTLRLRQRFAARLAATLAVCGIATLAVAASTRDGEIREALYIAGVALLLGALQMVVAWAAATGQADLLEEATHGHEQMFERLDGRFDQQQDVERERTNVVLVALDELRRRRDLRDRRNGA